MSTDKWSAWFECHQNHHQHKEEAQPPESPTQLNRTELNCWRILVSGLISAGSEVNPSLPSIPRPLKLCQDQVSILIYCSEPACHLWCLFALRWWGCFRLWAGGIRELGMEDGERRMKDANPYFGGLRLLRQFRFSQASGCTYYVRVHIQTHWSLRLEPDNFIADERGFHAHLYAGPIRSLDI